MNFKPRSRNFNIPKFLNSKQGNIKKKNYSNFVDEHFSITHKFQEI